MKIKSLKNIWRVKHDGCNIQEYLGVVLVRVTAAITTTKGNFEKKAAAKCYMLGYLSTRLCKGFAIERPKSETRNPIILSRDMI